MCSVTSTTNRVTSDACKTLYAQLSMALATTRRMQFNFNDGSSTWTQDTPWGTSIGSWVVPNPYPYAVQLIDY